MPTWILIIAFIGTAAASFAIGLWIGYRSGRSRISESPGDPQGHRFSNWKHK